MSSLPSRVTLVVRGAKSGRGARETIMTDLIDRQCAAVHTKFCNLTKPFAAFRAHRLMLLRHLPSNLLLRLTQERAIPAEHKDACQALTARACGIASASSQISASELRRSQKVCRETELDRWAGHSSLSFSVNSPPLSRTSVSPRPTSSSSLSNRAAEELVADADAWREQCSASRG